MASPSLWIENFGGYVLGATAPAQALARGWASGTGGGVLISDHAVGRALHLNGDNNFVVFANTVLYGNFAFGFAFTPTSSGTYRALRLVDSSGVYMEIRVGTNTWGVVYSPGSGNDISAQGTCALSSMFEAVWTETGFSLYVNNEAVVSRSWAAARRTARPERLGFTSGAGYAANGYYHWMYYGPSRLGMVRSLTAAPTTDSNSGSVKGTLPAALTTFDGDTSRVTYTEGSAQSTVLNAAGLSAIPSDAVIHAVKLTASAAGAGGVAAGKLTLETAAGASDVSEVAMALSYSPTTVVLNADPATSAAFIASELAAGTVKFGVREG